MSYPPDSDDALRAAVQRFLLYVRSYDQRMRQHLRQVTRAMPPPEQVAAVVEGARAFGERWQRVGQEAAAAAQRFSVEVGGSLTTLTEQISQQVREQLAPLLDAARQAALAWDKQAREGARVLAKRGWWLAPDMPMPLVNQAIEMERQGSGRRISRMICVYYRSSNCAPIAAMASRWDGSPYFRPRRHIFSEALWAHRARKYNLSVATLLPQLEGILADFARSTALTKEKQVKQMARRLRATSGPFSDLMFDTWLAQMGSVYGGSQHTTAYRLRGLNRDAVSHGRVLHYGSEMASLKLFLLLDTLHEQISKSLDRADAS